VRLAFLHRRRGPSVESRDRILRAIEFRRPDRVPVITWRAEGYEEWLRYGDHERHRTEVRELLGLILPMHSTPIRRGSGVASLRPTSAKLLKTNGVSFGLD